MIFLTKEPKKNKKAFLLRMQKGLYNNNLKDSVERDYHAGIDADP